MTAPLETEAANATTAYQLALAGIGVATVAEAIELWQSVPPTQRAATAVRWLNQAVAMVMTRRQRSRDLAMAYYRLTRALLTGKTVADPFKPESEPKYITLDTLRQEFAELAGVSVAELRRTPAAPTESPNAETPASGADRGRENDANAAAEPPDAPKPNVDEDRIEVEVIADVQAELAKLEKDAEQEARIVLAALGPDNLESKVREIDAKATADPPPPTELDARRQKAHDEAGARQAAAAARVVQNGARSVTWLHQENDGRVLGWVRFSKTGTPCGWCAMLISRGFVPNKRTGLPDGALYTSQDAAEYSDGDKYHDNCNCASLPVFSKGQVVNHPLFEMNRRYGALWPQVTSGLSGKAALSAWRAFIRAEAKTTQAASAETPAAA